MKQSLSQLKKTIREGYLDSEKKLFLKYFENTFRLKKDWDSDPTVIWEGEIVDPNLKHKYKIEIHYDEGYPFHRPKVYPLDKKIKNNRHQNPSLPNTILSGDICIFQDSFSDWVVGTDCQEIIKRATKWFTKYENGTLINELAPPEIERYYSIEDTILLPQIVVAETLVNIEDKKNGEFLWLPTKTGKLAFITTTKKDSDTDAVFAELTRLINLVSPQDPGDPTKMLLGRWYLLENEPFDPLPHFLSDLIKLIAGNVRAINLRSLVMEIEADPLHFIALCYKTKFNNIHWLIYDFRFIPPPKSKFGEILGFRRQTSYRRILQTNNFSKLNIFLTHHLNKKAIFRRISHYPLEKLDNSKVLILGCGTIGSRVIDLLAKSGVGEFYLADNDILQVGNLSRHILPLSKVGFAKASSIKDYLLQRNPFLSVEAYDGDITSLHAAKWLAEAIQGVDLVISCIGNDATETWINFATMARSKKTLFCRAYAHATIGEILLSIPNQICFSCMSELLSEDLTIPRPPKLKFEDMVMFDDADCGASFIPGSASDIDLIALHCVRIAIDILSSKDLKDSYWLIRGREFETDNNWQIDEELKMPYSILKSSPIPKKTCSICGFMPTK